MGSIRLVQVTPCGVKYATRAQEQGQEGIQLHVIPAPAALFTERSSSRRRPQRSWQGVPGNPGHESG